MPRRIESLFLDGPAGKLEALLEEPEDQPAREVALICHPHPQHGGTMHNKVVYRIARAIRRAGAVALRFNYRGVVRSEGSYDHGIGEMEDARAALAYLRSRYPGLPFSLAGFSFGSRIILKLGCELAGAERLIAAGYPANLESASAVNPEGVASPCPAPRFFIVSTHDQFCDVAAMEAYFARLSGPKKLLWIPADDHFFTGALDQLEEAVLAIAMNR